MIFTYGASSITMSKRDKILYIRDKWRIDNPVTPVVDHNQICQAEAERIYREVCIGDWNIATINETNIEETEELFDLIQPFILHLASEIVNITGNNYTYSRTIRDKLIRLLSLEGDFENHFRMFFRRAISIEHLYVAQNNRTLNTVVRSPLDSLQQLPPPARAGQLSSHKPKFAQIKFCSTIADTINDFTCGVCADDLSQQTMPVLGCKHALCSDCIIGQIKARAKSFICCPFCREEVTEISVNDDIVRNNLNSFITNEF
jgi:hypothetical protein